MPDLSRDFFKRDLSDAEWKALGQQLQAEGEVADRFLAGAERYYLDLGLKAPKPPRGPLGGGWGLAGIGLVLGLSAGLGLGAWLWRASAVPLVPAAPVTAAAAEPGAEPMPGALTVAAPPASAASAPGPAPQAPSRSAPASPPAREVAAKPARPERASAGAPSPQALLRPTLAPLPTLAPGPPPQVASPGFPALETVIELKRPGLVTARVLDAAGVEQRLLKAGLLDAGRWRFGWDGRDEAGRGVAPGSYTIEVQEGDHVLRKTVEVGKTEAAR